MSDLQIVHYPHPALRWKSREVIRIDAQLKQWVKQMFQLMYEARGIGLAANQVALPYRLFVINPTADPDEKDQEMVFLNPEIVRKNGSEESEEGCLSLPEVYGQVTRAERIVVEAFDLNGQEFQAELSGLHARVVQHEYDHLDGVLFTDRVSEDVQQELQPLMDDLATQFSTRQSNGDIPDDESLKTALKNLETERTA